MSHGLAGEGPRRSADSLEFLRVATGEVDIELLAVAPEFLVMGLNVLHDPGGYTGHDLLCRYLHGSRHNATFGYDGPPAYSHIEAQYGTHSNDGQVFYPAAVYHGAVADGHTVPDEAQTVGIDMYGSVLLYGGAVSDTDASVVRPENDPVSDVTVPSDPNVTDDLGRVADPRAVTHRRHSGSETVQRHHLVGMRSQNHVDTEIVLQGDLEIVVVNRAVRRFHRQFHAGAEM